MSQHFGKWNGGNTSGMLFGIAARSSDDSSGQ
jgi:hypothetical protein